MASEKSSSNIGRLVDQFMKMAEEVATGDDWKESDGWVGKMVLVRPNDRREEYVYKVENGRMTRTDSEGPFVAVITMSTTTFVKLLEAAFDGRAEEEFEEKYARRHIEYEGARWIVDSERFRLVFKRMGEISIKKLVSG